MVVKVPTKVQTGDTIGLPWGYTVTVRLIDNVLMDILDPDADGLWDAPTRSIVIRGTVTPKKIAYILTHEMVHVIADWQDWAIEEGYAEPQA